MDDLSNYRIRDHARWREAMQLNRRRTEIYTKLEYMYIDSLYGVDSEHDYKMYLKSANRELEQIAARLEELEAQQ